MTVEFDMTYEEIKDKLWSGAKDTVEELTNDEFEQVMSILEDYYWEDYYCTDGSPTMTQINDFLWFERDTIAEWLGYKDFDAIMNRNNNEEENEDD